VAFTYLKVKFAKCLCLLLVCLLVSVMCRWGYGNAKPYYSLTHCEVESLAYQRLLTTDIVDKNIG